MGYLATVLVRFDALHGIKTDPKFGKNLAAAMQNVASHGGIRQVNDIRCEVPALGFVNAATVLEVHHAGEPYVVKRVDFDKSTEIFIGSPVLPAPTKRPGLSIQELRDKLEEYDHENRGGGCDRLEIERFIDWTVEHP